MRITPRRVVGLVVKTLHRIGGVLLPDADRSVYSFDQARSYWRNVPRAEGGNPFSTERLAEMSDDEVTAQFDRELDAAREKPERKLAFDIAERSIQGIPHPTVLDYGSGIGFNGFELLVRRPDADVMFADIAAANLATLEKIAAAKRLSVHTVLVHEPDASDLTRLGPFDLIVSMGVLHHTPFADRIVERLCTFLRPGGIFAAMLYNDTYLRIARRWAGRRLRPSGAGFGRLTDPVVANEANPYSRAYTEPEALALFAPLDMLEVCHPEPTYTTYVFRKPA